MLYLRQLWDSYGLKLLRFGGVSLVTMTVTLSTLAAALFAGLPPVAANLFAVAVGAVPAYLLNRKYVWKQTGTDHSFTKEVAPFWAMTLLGFVVSTIAVAFVGTQTEFAPLLLATQFAAFAGLWLLKFFFLEHYLWGTAT